MSTPSTITVTLDLDQLLPSHDPYQRSDGEWIDSPTTMRYLIVDTAARMVVEEEKQAIRERAREYANEQVNEYIKAQLPAMLEELLSEEVAETDAFGVRSKSKPLRQRIADMVTKQLTVSGRGTYRGDSVLDQVIEIEVRRALQKDLREYVEAAKADLRRTLQARAAELVAEGVRV